MKKFIITLDRTQQIIISAHSFEILDDILYLYDEEGIPLSILKKWDIFNIEQECDREKKSADDFYDILEKST